ncbi:cytochrome c551 [Oceanobacillus sp. Castelsardo]|uniref:cytochrome c551 n=1 Tax=Oceanobacillus sp. Castelsardo TaxID=1851204 RepID=UPI0008395CCF|nr:cytochrome c [Oceanobacillus sp. Castelsardo]
MKKWLLAIIFGTVLTLAACGGASNDDNAEEPPADDNATEEQADTGDTATEEETDDGAGETVDTAAGEEVYASNCAMCHGADLSGGAGKDLTKVGSKYSAEEIKDIVQNGIGNMQPQKQVTGEDLDNLANWLAEKK